MKRKIKKFSGEEGSVVRTRSDKEFEEDSKYGGYGRYMPKTKEYTFDQVKDKLSGLFGGKSKAKDEEAYDFDSDTERVAKPKATPKAEPEATPKEKTEKSSVDFSKFDTKSYTDKPVGGGNISTTGPKTASVNRNAASKDAAPKADKKADAPKADKKADTSTDRQGDVKPKSVVFKKDEETSSGSSKYEDVTSKKDLGSQGSFKMNTNKPVTRYRKKEEEAPEVKVSKSKMDYEPEAMPKAASKALQDDTQYKTKYGDFSFQKGFKKDEDKKEKKTRSSADIRAGRYKSGGSVSSASKRADGIAQRGKTKGKMY
jgi:hypothetical protein